MSIHSATLPIPSNTCQGLHYPRNLEDIRATIISINEEITQQEMKTKRLKQLRLDYQTLLSPFHRIPTEILGYILMYAVEKNSFGWKPSHCRSDTYNLGRICRRWRNLTQSMPCLWSKIFINIYPTHTYSSAAFRQLKDLLLHSKNSPLSIEVEMNVSGTVSINHDHDSSTQFFDLVLQQSHRWRSFKYTQPQNGDYGHIIFLDKVLEREMRILECLEVELDHRYDQQVPLELGLRILSSPLQTIHFSFGGVRIKSFLPILPCVPLLTRLRVEVYTKDAIWLLVSSPNLVIAHFILVGPGTNDNQTNSRPGIPRALRALTVEPSTLSCLRQIPYFLCTLTCPSLTFLSISDTNTDPEKYPSPFSLSLTNSVVDFLRRSGSPKTLKLIRLPLSMTEIIQILLSPPALVLHSLEIHFIIEDRLAAFLLISRVFPRLMLAFGMLREVVFTVGTDWEDNAFENMLQLRVNEKPKLKSLFLKIRGDVKHLDIWRLERINATSDFAVRVVQGEDEKEVVGYWVKPVVGLRRHCWRDLLSF